MEINKIALFGDLNQGRRRESWYQCSIYSLAINLQYNCWIRLSEDDLDIIAHEMVKDGVMDLKVGAYMSDASKYVISYITKRQKYLWIDKLPEFKQYSNRTESDKIRELNKNWFSTVILLKVNNDFVKDSRDWKIERFEDYVNYKWRINHFTNLSRWIWRGDKSVKKYDFILDSYSYNEAENSWLYEVDAKEIFEDLLWNNSRLFKFKED